MRDNSAKLEPKSLYQVMAEHEAAKLPSKPRENGTMTHQAEVLRMMETSDDGAARVAAAVIRQEAAKMPARIDSSIAISWTEWHRVRASRLAFMLGAMQSHLQTCGKTKDEVAELETQADEDWHRIFPEDAKVYDE